MLIKIFYSHLVTVTMHYFLVVSIELIYLQYRMKLFVS